MRARRATEPLFAAVLLLATVLAAVVATMVLTAATQWPTAAAVAGGTVFGALFGAVSWACASARSALPGRIAVAVILGVVGGELAAMVLFAGPTDRVLAAQADSAPEVVHASAELGAARQARTGLDDAVAQADRRRDEALVVARCEFNPSPQCPQVRITGVPGAGPQTRTANEFLADAQRQADAAVADRQARAAGLDAVVADRESALRAARHDAGVAGLGARWAAMNGYTGMHPAALVLRVLVDLLFVLLSLLPLTLRRWRGTTTAERGAQACAEQERAELDADTAIALKRAEVRSTIEQLWAEQELESARLAVAAQNQIDRERQRRRVAEALGTPEPARPVDSVVVGPAALPAGRVPEVAEPQRGGGLLPVIPVIPEATRAAVRWIRPFVPSVVAGAIDNATKPLRQVFEETEEVHFTLRRTHRVTVESDGPVGPGGVGASGAGQVEPLQPDGRPELPGRRQLPPPS